MKDDFFRKQIGRARGRWALAGPKLETILANGRSRAADEPTLALSERPPARDEGQQAAARPRTARKPSEGGGGDRGGGSASGGGEGQPGASMPECSSPSPDAVTSSESRSDPAASTSTSQAAVQRLLDPGVEPTTLADRPASEIERASAVATHPSTGDDIVRSQDISTELADMLATTPSPTDDFAGQSTSHEPSPHASSVAASTEGSTTQSDELATEVAAIPSDTATSPSVQRSRLSEQSASAIDRSEPASPSAKLQSDLASSLATVQRSLDSEVGVTELAPRQVSAAIEHAPASATTDDFASDAASSPSVQRSSLSEPSASAIEQPEPASPPAKLRSDLESSSHPSSAAAPGEVAATQGGESVTEAAATEPSIEPTALARPVGSAVEHAPAPATTPSSSDGIAGRPTSHEPAADLESTSHASNVAASTQAAATQGGAATELGSSHPRIRSPEHNPSPGSARERLHSSDASLEVRREPATAANPSEAAIQRLLEPNTESTALADQHTPAPAPRPDPASAPAKRPASPSQAQNEARIDTPARTPSLAATPELAEPSPPRVEASVELDVATEPSPLAKTETPAIASPTPTPDPAALTEHEATVASPTTPAPIERTTPPPRPSLAEASTPPREPEPSAERRPRRRAVEPEPQPTIDRPILHITIGRVEIHAPPRKSDNNDVRRRAPTLSLSDYLNRRR